MADILRSGSARLAFSAWFIAAVVQGCGGNSHVVRVPVNSSLAEQEEPTKPLVRGMRVALRRPMLANDPERRLDITNTVAESYPTLSHMAVAVPAALREVGFDVVEVRDVKEAEDLHAQMVLDLESPQVSGFRPASGDRVTLVGSSYDIRVQYRGVLQTADLQPMGVVTGYGQNTNRFLFMEPLFKEAMVGAFIATAVLGTSIFMLYAVARFGLIGSLAQGGEPFGICDDVDPDTPAGRFLEATDACSRAVNYVMSTAFVMVVSITTGLAGSIAGDLGETITNAVLALLHAVRVDPAWRGMVKQAHDQAARDLAVQMAQRALHPYTPPKRPLPPPPPPPVEPAGPSALPGSSAPLPSPTVEASPASPAQDGHAAPSEDPEPAPLVAPPPPPPPSRR